jgi:hypothetical protein
MSVPREQKQKAAWLASDSMLSRRATTGHDDAAVSAARPVRVIPRRSDGRSLPPA